jgi:NAD+ diphosphatase
MDQLTARIESPAFTAGAVDRAAAFRTDDGWVRRARDDERSRVLVVRDHDVAVDASGGIRLGRLRDVDAAAADAAVLLGVADDVAWFAVADGPHDGAAFAPLREVAGALAPDEALFAATAVGLVGWHARAAFCPACGGSTRAVHAGHARSCERCDVLHFPRTDPAVIMHVTAGDRCVLGRRRGAPPTRWSTMAGFVEVGETLEHTVAREVEEETGLTVTAVGYEQSQPWPFPCSLMIGFRAEVVPGDLHGDGEHVELAWFDRDELLAAIDAGTVTLPPPHAIGRTLIQRWLYAP